MKPIREANAIIKLWREHGPNTYPIDLSLVLNEIVLKRTDDHVSVVTESFESFEGALIRHPDGWRILINDGIKVRARKNFTLAHEIAHFIGHRTLQSEFKCGPKELHDFDGEGLEVEANTFAAHLLMPPDCIRKYDERPFTAEHLLDLSEHLGVSKQAAGLRWVGLSARKIAFVVSRDGFICWGRASATAFAAGIFFRKDEPLLPALMSSNATDVRSEPQCFSHDPGAVHPFLACRESIHSTAIGDYIYTCLEYR